jgi:hypothetical protein
VQVNAHCRTKEYTANVGDSLKTTTSDASYNGHRICAECTENIIDCDVSAICSATAKQPSAFCMLPLSIAEYKTEATIAASLIDKAY